VALLSYYATACCAAALGSYGGVTAQPTLRKAVEWVLDTQRADGSWGRWTGTYEETAYAVHILLQTRKDWQRCPWPVS
jgi:squalene cyclase